MGVSFFGTIRRHISTRFRRAVCTAVILAIVIPAGLVISAPVASATGGHCWWNDAYNNDSYSICIYVAGTGDHVTQVTAGLDLFGLNDNFPIHTNTQCGHWVVWSTSPKNKIAYSTPTECNSYLGPTGTHNQYWGPRHYFSLNLTNQSNVNVQWYSSNDHAWSSITYLTVHT
jgi:hypothetical protein